MDSERVLVWKWPDRPSSAIMLAAVSGRSAAGTPGPRVSHMFPAAVVASARCICTCVECLRSSFSSIFRPYPVYDKTAVD